MSNILSYWKRMTFSCFLIMMLISEGFGQGGSKGTTPAAIQKKSVANVEETKKFTFPDNFNGFNAQMLRGPSWKEKGFIDQVQALHPKLIRYPGGTVASYWDWKAGWLKDEIDIKKEWKTIRKNPIMLEDLKFACDSTSASPIFVLNMMTSTMQHQIDMLRHARKIGLPIEFVELDNELYLGEEFYVSKFPTGVEYATEANKWIAAIKAEFKGVKIGVVGHSARESAAKKEKKHFARTNSWNHDVFSTIKNADGMTFHVYGGTGLNYLGAKAQESDNDEVNIDNIQAIFEKKESIPIILGVPFQRWRNSNAYDYTILPEGMKAWITEYNLFEREGVMAGTWVHGLYALMQSILFLENQKTELICYHNLTTSAQFAAIFNNEQGFAKAANQKTNKSFEFTAAGHCLSLFGKALSEGKQAYRIKFSEIAEITGSRGQTYPAVNGWLVKGDKSSKIIVTNLSSEHVQVDFSKMMPAKCVWSMINSEPHAQVASEQDLKQKKGNGTTVNLAPYSVTIIEVE